MRILGIVIAIGMGVFILSGICLAFDTYSEIVGMDTFIENDYQIRSDLGLTIPEMYNRLWTRLQIILVFVIISIGLEIMLINKIK